MASMARGPWDPLAPFGLYGPWNVGTLGPYWPKYNDSKRDQGGQPPDLKARWVPNHKWAHLRQILAPISMFPKMAKTTSRPKLAVFQPLASGNHQRPPAQDQQAFPSIQGKDSPSPMCSISRIQVWCIYGIIYHYAPFLLRNTIVIFPGQNYAISIQVPKSITHFEGSLFSNSVLQSLEAANRPFKDPNHLALPELGCFFFSGLFQG
ncbi:hypothetical protein O181_022424 [Austropuccinia psidii MF-1]|uniref:Uncharacterized protein n=1 Tax=Austropuccinia psidii MF-1 TaxID=1389203 RepID=A0A9Q3GXN4_9BASI|nr:hypothetical protein [Austropuccinia psidii MF-1]